MTSGEAIAIERLAQRATFEPEAAERLRETWRAHQHALEIEDHVALIALENDWAFLLRGVALALAEAAVGAEDADTAGLLTGWARDGVPRGARELLTDIVLSRKATA